MPLDLNCDLPSIAMSAVGHRLIPARAVMLATSRGRCTSRPRQNTKRISAKILTALVISPVFSTCDVDGDNTMTDEFAYKTCPRQLCEFFADAFALGVDCRLPIMDPENEYFCLSVTVSHFLTRVGLALGCVQVTVGAWLRRNARTDGGSTKDRFGRQISPALGALIMKLSSCSASNISGDSCRCSSEIGPQKSRKLKNNGRGLLLFPADSRAFSFRYRGAPPRL